MKTHTLMAAMLLSALWFSAPVLAEPAQAKTTATSSTGLEQQKTNKAPEASLSEEKARILKDAMAKVRTDNANISDQIKTKRKELAALLKTEKFDKAAYLAKHAEMQSLIDKMSKARAEALATVAEKFSAADRKILAERFEKRKGHRARDGKSKKTGDAGKQN